MLWDNVRVLIPLSSLLHLPRFRRAPRPRLLGVTMGETTLAIAVGALLLIGAAVLATDLLARIKADTRAQELRTVIDSVRLSYQNDVFYTGLTASTIAPGLPGSMTDPARTQVFLGGGAIPVHVWPGTATSSTQNVGGHGPITFLVFLGSSTFPIITLADCIALAALYDAQTGYFRGFQLRSAARFNPSRLRFDARLVLDPSTEVFTANAIASAAGADPTTLIPNVLEGGSVLFDRAGPFQLKRVTHQHISHACSRLVNRPEGAVLILSFT